MVTIHQGQTLGSQVATVTTLGQTRDHPPPLESSSGQATPLPPALMVGVCLAPAMGVTKVLAKGPTLATTSPPPCPPPQLTQVLFPAPGHGRVAQTLAGQEVREVDQGDPPTSNPSPTILHQG